MVQPRLPAGCAARVMPAGWPGPEEEESPACLDAFSVPSVLQAEDVTKTFEGKEPCEAPPSPDQMKGGVYYARI